MKGNEAGRGKGGRGGERGPPCSIICEPSFADERGGVYDKLNNSAIP